MKVLTDKDKGTRIASVASEFAHLCPKLKKGVRHAGDMLEVLDIVMLNGTGGGKQGGIHDTSVYFFFSFAYHSCDEGNAAYFIRLDKTLRRQAFHAGKE